MKSILLGLVLVATSHIAWASAQAEVKTVYTCQQSDGDFWYEVGVIPVAQGQLKLIVLAHNGDSGLTQSIYEGSVKGKKSAGKAVFQGPRNESTLVITEGRFAKGNFKLEIPGPHEVLIVESMDCFENSTITYIPGHNLEPRISVGN